MLYTCSCNVSFFFFFFLLYLCSFFPFLFFQKTFPAAIDLPCSYCALFHFSLSLPLPPVPPCYIYLAYLGSNCVYVRELSESSVDNRTTININGSLVLRFFFNIYFDRREHKCIQTEWASCRAMPKRTGIRISYHVSGCVHNPPSFLFLG